MVEVKIIKDGMLWNCTAESMRDEAGSEILLVKMQNKNPAVAVDKKASEERFGPTKVKRVKRPARATKKTVDPVVLEVKSPRNGRRGGCVPVICKTTNVRFESLQEAARTLFPEVNTASAVAAICQCCRGNQKSTRGMQFEYAN